MDTYICKVCGFVYDPAEGHPESGVDPGVPFGTLPEDWKCPQCGAPESEFETENTPMPGMVAPVGETS